MPAKAFILFLSIISSLDGNDYNLLLFVHSMVVLYVKLCTMKLFHFQQNELQNKIVVSDQESLVSLLWYSYRGSMSYSGEGWC